MTQKVLPKQKVERGQRENETKEQNGCLDTEDEEEEEEEAESEGKLPHSYNTQQGNPRSIQKTICGLKWMCCVCVCVQKHFSFNSCARGAGRAQRGGREEEAGVKRSGFWILLLSLKKYIKRNSVNR